MRTCASCGKANNPIRKYCTRCGKSLISFKEDKLVPAPTSVVTETKIPDILPDAGKPGEKYVASDSAKVTTNDEWVRPSQIARDRVRTGSTSSGKSEMEKAMEAFAKAETAGVVEAEGSGIVEPRMLRASEVRELMSEGSVLPQETAPPVQPEARPAPSPAPAPPVVPPVDTPPPLSPEPAPVAPSVAPHPPVSEVVPEVVPEVSPPKAAPVPSTNKFDPPVVKPTPPVETPPPDVPKTPVKSPIPEPVVTSAANISLDTRVPEIEDVLAHVSEPEDLQDSKIKDYVANLTHQHAELRQVKDDMRGISTRLDEFVRSCLNDSEVKRIHYESVTEQMRFAKKEYETAKKEYERVDKKRKKEISSLEGRIKSVEKNISKSNNALKKRINELDKVRAKIAQLQAQDP
ncbi:MAG: hypothetical protein KAU48_10115 [Candidatus Thorarchaeota archaeon]|nr:hypothetical protein [Candidatus Thorarchaeota archaeon]